MAILLFINLKGGVAKTTNAVAVAECLAVATASGLRGELGQTASRSLSARTLGYNRPAISAIFEHEAQHEDTLLFEATQAPKGPGRTARQ